MKYKTTQKDRYGNMRSLEIETEGNNLEVPPMGSGIPQYEAVGGLAENHPGGPKGSDTVPAWLTPGEFVVNKEAVDIYGPQIKKMNDIGREIQDGDMNPNQAPPMYASTGKAAKEYPAEKKLANQIAIYEHLKSRGLSDKAAAGLMAQIQHESAGTFDYQWQEHGGGGGHGLFQMDPGKKGWLGPYKQWLRKKHMDDMNKMELESVVPGGPVLNPTMQFDSPQNQLDFAIDLYTNPNAVPHPTDPGQYYIGPGNAASIRTVLGNPDVDLIDMSNTLVDTWINPGEKDVNPKNREARQKDTQAMWDLIQKGAFVPPQDPSGVATWITEAQQLWKDMDKKEVGEEAAIPSNDSSSTGQNKGYRPWNPFTWTWGDTDEVKKKFNYDKPLKKRMQDGGVVHAFMGQEVPRYLADLQDDELEAYLNQYVIPRAENLVHRSGAGKGDSDDLGHEPTTMLPPPPALDIPVSDWNADPNKLNPPVVQGDVQEIEDVIDPNVMQNVTKSEDLIGNLYESIDSGQGAIPPHSDLLDTIDIPYADRHPGYAYDQIVQKEIAGSPVPDIDTLNDIPPGPFTGELGADEEDRAPLIPPMPGEEITVDDRREDYRPSGFVPTMLEANPYMADNLQLGNITELEAEYQDAMNTAMLSNKDDPDYEAKQAYVKKVKEKLDAAKSGHKILDAYRDVAPQFGGEPQWIKDAEARKILADEQATIDELKSRLNDPNITKEYKELLEKKIAEKQKALETEAAKVQTEAQGNSLEQIAIQIDDTTEAEITSKLNSQEGKKALEDGSSNKEEVSKTRKMFDFLFGDLIDKGEIGRAIAVYLGSRALGYDHGSSIGYVAKQYLKRVDAKNAQMDKWILANAHLYTKDSLAEFKRTKDPSKLIPIGATPRSTGKKEMQYHKELGKMMAYEFKIKNAQGDDTTYWSFDPTGKNKSLKVEEGWTEENIIDVSTEVINEAKDVLKAIWTARDKDTIGTKDKKRVIYHSGRGTTPGIIPEAIAGETAQWLFDRDIPPGKFLQPLDEAYAALIESNKKLLEEDEDAVLHSSLIPFLEEATIKLRLEDLTYKDANGKRRAIPSPAKATVDGKGITMDTKDLVDLQQQIESVFKVKGASRFWAEAANQWGDRLPGDKKKTYRDYFVEQSKKPEWEGWTPFALFALTKINQEITRAGQMAAQQ